MENFFVKGWSPEQSVGLAPPPPSFASRTSGIPIQVEGKKGMNGKRLLLPLEKQKRRSSKRKQPILPPNQRTKSHFLKIEILVRWGVDVTVALEDPKHPDRHWRK